MRPTRDGLPINTENKTILDRKPNLKVCSNHRKEPPKKRWLWMSTLQGQARVNERGQYYGENG